LLPLPWRWHCGGRCGPNCRGWRRGSSNLVCSAPDAAHFQPRLLAAGRDLSRSPDAVRVRHMSTRSAPRQARSTVCVSPPRTRLVNHQMAPFLTVQSASCPDSSSAASATERGLVADDHHRAADRRPFGGGDQVGDRRVGIERARGFEVEAQCLRGLLAAPGRADEDARASFGRRGSSHCAICFACRSPRSDSLREASGTVSSASAWRHRINSISVSFMSASPRGGSVGTCRDGR
jgi:hypothetical protein